MYCCTTLCITDVQKTSVFKDFSELNRHVKLSHCKLLLKSTCLVMLALLHLLIFTTKRIWAKCHIRSAVSLFLVPVCGLKLVYSILTFAVTEIRVNLPLK